MTNTKTCQRQLQVLLLGSGRNDAISAFEKRLKAEGQVFTSLPAADYTLSAVHPASLGCAIVDLKGLNEGEREHLDSIVNCLFKDGVPVIAANAEQGSVRWQGGVIHEVSDLNDEGIWGLMKAHIAIRGSQTSESDRKKGAESDTIEQLKMAGRVQHDFLPARLPNSEKIKWAAVFRPAEWVSGDIYDVARLDERHIGFYVADAVGHSMPAALLTMFLKHKMVMRETVGNTYRIFEPAEVISRLNVLMTEQGLSGCQFATVCYCLLNTETLELKFARAGHPYPLVIRNDGEIFTLESRGPLLGVFRDSRFVQGSTKLEKGDKLLLYTDGADGLIGITNQSGELEFISQFRTISRMPVDQMLTEIDLAAEQYIWPEGQKDDITALGFEVI